jgi:hypothetical protein
MKVASVPNPGWTLALGVFLLAIGIGDALYAAHGLEHSDLFVAIFYFGTALLMACWILADCRRLGVKGYVDQGLVLFFGWPVVLPYHLFKTRRWKAFVALAGFLALFVVTSAISVALYHVLTTIDGQ